MKRSKKRLYILTAFTALLITISSFSVLLSKSDRDIYADVRWNITVFGQIYKAINERYIEEIDPEKFMRAGIEGMLDRLDPYTVYLEPDGQEEIEIMTRGKYYGVGMRIVVRNGWATVAEQPFSSSPSFRAGIREGDQIIEIDNESTEGLSLNKTAGKLRGKEKGSEVTIKIQRVGEEKPLIFTLIRDEIIVSDIDFADFIEPGIGYIDLSQFNRGADQQVRDAIERLKNQGLEGLIFDLRGNPGGLLDVAVSVADCFIPEGEMVVYTKGRTKNSMQEYRAQRPPELGNLPLVVLVDGGSASASEIVSGAIQDLDRGVIMGRESFGKGLVQTVIPLDRRGETQVKMTTAAYYMPSDRLIQRPDIFDRGPQTVFYDQEETTENKDDKEKEIPAKKFYTKNGRTVYGGGGIKPDVEVKNQSTKDYVIALLRRSMFFNFSLNYVADHPDLPQDLVITDEILNDFFAFVKTKEFEYKPVGFSELENLEKIAKENEYYDQMSSNFENMKSTFEAVKEQNKQDALDQIKLVLKREISGKLYGADAATRVMFANDSTVIKAVELIKDTDRYRDILGGQVALNK